MVADDKYYINTVVFYIFVRIGLVAQLPINHNTFPHSTIVSSFCFI